MKTNRSTKLKALITALAFTGTLVLADAKPAHAYSDGGGSIIVFVYAIAATAAVLGGTLATVVCTPVAAINASKNENGFSGAFKECWNWSSDSEQPASTEADRFGRDRQD